MEFWTTLINKRKGRLVVTTPDGTPIVVLAPGQQHRICAGDPKFLYSRFSRVTYLPGGKVEFNINSDWKSPWTDQHVIELLNLTRPEQIISIDGNFYTALCGLPTLVPISVNDPLIETARVTWKLMTRKFTDDGRYVQRVTRVEQVKEPRGRKEMRAIKKEILLVEEAKIAEAVDRRFPSLKGPSDESPS